MGGEEAARGIEAEDVEVAVLEAVASGVELGECLGLIRFELGYGALQHRFDLRSGAELALRHNAPDSQCQR
jgi:hypothetical protein